MEDSIQRRGSRDPSGAEPRELAKKITIEDVDYHIPLVGTGYDNLDFGGATPNALDEVTAAGVESPALVCAGKQTIVLHVEYEDGSVVANLGVDLIGYNATPARCPAATQFPLNKNRQTGALKSGYYLGETVIIPIEGAKQFIVVNETLLTAKVCVWATTI